MNSELKIFYFFSDKINTWFNAFIIILVATLVLLVFVVYAYFTEEKIFAVKPGGWLFSILAGIAVGGASISSSKCLQQVQI